MPLNDIAVQTFFDDSTLDDNLPLVNEVFWSALIGHIEQDYETPPRTILDIGCHTGGLLSNSVDRCAVKVDPFDVSGQSIPCESEILALTHLLTQ